jgi:hypothetical protein
MTPSPPVEPNRLGEHGTLSPTSERLCRREMVLKGSRRRADERMGHLVAFALQPARDTADAAPSAVR